MTGGDVDFEFSDLYANIFRFRRRLGELGEKDEAHDDEVSKGTDIETMRREVARLESKLRKVEKPLSQERQDDIEQRFAGHDNVVFLVRRALLRCATLKEAKTFFEVMRKQANEFGDPSGRVFSMEDVNTACSKTTCEFNRRSLDEVSDQELATGEDTVGKQSAKRGRKPKAKSKAKIRAKAKPPTQTNEDDADSDCDLDAEQAIDLDIELNETEMRGLIDLFESPLEPVYDDGRRAWETPLPPGAWVSDDNALLGRLNKRGISAALELMGRIPGPGQKGFNSYVTARLQHKGISMDMRCEPNPQCPPLQPHQQAVEFLLHAASPIERLLVDHPTGCGKTREMIAVLDGYFHDPRPKIPIFPTDAVCRNFYLELLRWPNRYRNYFCCIEAALARRAAGLDPETGDWKAVRNAMWTLAGIPETELRSMSARFRECLEMSGTFVCGKLRKGRRFEFRTNNPGEEFPSAPLRALGYTSAGGSNIKLDMLTGMPLSSLFKVGFGKPYSNVYDRKIVLMDEVHNLVRSSTRYTEQLQTLRKKLSTAENLVLVGFTATPIPNEKSEGRLLLDTIKGETHLGLLDEGFISSFPFKPPHLFPRSFPPGVPEVSLTPNVQHELCCFVDLYGDSLLAYDLHAREPDIKGKQLRVYCNMFCWGSNFHDGKMGCKADVMARPEEVAPKLYAVVREVVSPMSGRRTKALVLVRRASGYNAMVALMREAGRVAVPPFKVATMENLSEFNARENARGENFLVMVAETTECGEGISFKAVRRQFITDVPETPADLIQQCGRANRMYGHQVLDAEEQTLRTQIFAALLPRWMRDDALSVWCYRTFARRGTPSAHAEQLGCDLRRRLEDVQVRSLDEFKVMVDFFASRRLGQAQKTVASKGISRPKEGKAFKLGTHDVADFLDAIGLREAAHSLRQKRGDDENDAAENSEDERAVTMDAHEKAAQAEESHSAADAQEEETSAVTSQKFAGNEVGIWTTRAEGGEMDDSAHATAKDQMSTPDEKETLDANMVDSERAVAQDQRAIIDGNGVVDVCKSARVLLRAILKLHATSRADVARMSSGATQTEDQRALQNLKHLYDEFLPALSAIRNSAVDRMVLSRPEERAVLEATAALTQGEGEQSGRHEASVPPPIHKELTARLEALFPEKLQTCDPTGEIKTASLRPGRRPKTVASNPPEPTGSTVLETLKSVGESKTKSARRGRQLKATLLSGTPETTDIPGDHSIHATAVPFGVKSVSVSKPSQGAPPVRWGRSAKASGLAPDGVEQPQGATVPSDSGAFRPLRRARSKMSESFLRNAAEAVKIAAQEVACGLCTYINAPGRTCCEMCESSLEAANFKVPKLTDLASPARKRTRKA